MRCVQRRASRLKTAGPLWEFECFMAIHPTAIIDRHAELDSSVDVGPYAVIEGPARIGAHTRIRAHAVVTGFTHIGERCDIHPHAIVGDEPQDFHWGGERSYCRIGSGVVIREGVTIHRGTHPESSTEVGDGCFLLANSHVGHNCVLGREVKLINGALLAGHVTLGDGAILSGNAIVHQFVRIGTLAFIAGGARATMDVPPFMICHGDSTIVQHNVIGMRRAGYDPAGIHEIRNAFRTLYRSALPFRKAVEQLAPATRTPAGLVLIEFLQSESRRGFAAGRVGHRQRAANAQGSLSTATETDCDDRSSSPAKINIKTVS